ncbi:hypothetical protein [Actinomadura sp. NEAU-AAG7]|uniref:hypothetical protein n=1 Tax=Actinomadura sp. NEAU-AAG7 TaxID=2839640 RepID=UPI001BE44C69|nr:hypothetical protein [Actinomadura sp. NEAU-AAG7]MBT2207031.1 hypothetical protein [Actinomadura sp. NEAU-AAG7]
MRGPFDGTAQLDATPLHRAEIQRVESCFPGTHAWFGHHTRRWWAYVPWPEPGLVEAANPDALMDEVAKGWR